MNKSLLTLLMLTIVVVITASKTHKTSKKKTGHNFKYYPAKDVKDDTLICPNPRPGSAGSSSSFSLWGFMTMAVVASTVAANIVNNANNNNNNNNNNDNNDNQNQNTINNNADDNSNTNMNLIIPGRRRAFSSKNMSDSFVRLFEQDCFLHVLCRSIEKRENSVNRFSTKLVALASGLAISDFFGQNKLQDSNIFSVIQNSDSKSCHSNYECPLFEILSPMND